MKKFFIFIIISFFSVFLWAKTQLGFNYRFYYYRPSHVFSVSETSLWGKNIKFGFTSTFGFGFEKFWENNSKALLYGPSFSLGPAVQFTITNKIDAILTICASANYAHYPVILRGELSAIFNYKITDLFYLGMSYSFMFPKIEKFGYENIRDTRFSTGIICGVSL